MKTLLFLALMALSPLARAEIQFDNLPSGDLPSLDLKINKLVCRDSRGLVVLGSAGEYSGQHYFTVPGSAAPVPVKQGFIYPRLKQIAFGFTVASPWTLTTSHLKMMLNYETGEAALREFTSQKTTLLKCEHALEGLR